MDDIQSRLAVSLASRQSEVPRAEALVNEETAAFLRWLAVIPVVGELHRRAESIRQQEVDRALHFLQDADPLVVAQIERLSQSLVRKLLHEPTARLRHEADYACLETYMIAITSLFDLPDAGAALQGKGEAC
jgi:glutamyl-tRNA reductase